MTVSENSVHRGFDAALTGSITKLELTDGRTLRLSAQRWHDPADSADKWLLERCHGATLDLGCGPGRLVEALQAQGIPALGVDFSAVAVRHCLDRGAPAVHGDLFDSLPDEGNWRHVVLADGNIGIGGDPVRLLRRALELVGSGGSVLVETASAFPGLWRGGARLSGHRQTADDGWFPWAVLGLDALPGLAHRAGLRVLDSHREPHRHFARLEAL